MSNGVQPQLRKPEFRESIINVTETGKRVVSENVMMGQSHVAMKSEWDSNKPSYLQPNVNQNPNQWQ